MTRRPWGGVMMPSLTATTTRRGSFAGAGLASLPNAASDTSPAGGDVAGTVCMSAARLAAALPAQGSAAPLPRPRRLRNLLSGNCEPFRAASRLDAWEEDPV
jgi:hypothetical protein